MPAVLIAELDDKMSIVWVWVWRKRPDRVAPFRADEFSVSDILGAEFVGAPAQQIKGWLKQKLQEHRPDLAAVI